MHMRGSETLPGTPEALWNILFDPEMIAATIPGCRSLHLVGEDRYEGVVEARLGLFAQTIDATLTVTDKRYPHHYRILIDAQGKGLSVTADLQVELVPDGPGATVMHYDSTARLGGALAGLGTFGEPFARSLIAQGMEELKRRVTERMR